jgi:predicted DNA-binding protein (MmcQ/YjbR family)
MTRQELRDYCLAKRGVTEEFPFGVEFAVHKVMNKMFSLVPILPDDDHLIIVKCDPTWAVLLRQTYPAVQPAYHFNKTHWNQITMDGTVPHEEICEMIDHSYDLVVKGLTRAQKKQLAELAE